MSMRVHERGFTLMELIIAITLTVALMAGLAAFLNETIATRTHLVPEDARIQRLLALNIQLRHELGAASPDHIDLRPHLLIFESRAAYQALPPGRYLYRYVFHPTAQTLSLTLRAAPQHRERQSILFHSVVLSHVQQVQFAGLSHPIQADGPLYWTSRAQTLGVTEAHIGWPLVAIRLTVAGRAGYQHLPPLLYRLGRP
jgi:Tfp pilus assembly protein PilE